MQKSYFPMQYHRITCAYNQGSAHKKCSTGTPHDYPTDLGGKDSGRDWMLAPCDMIVLRRYTHASHAIWMRSKNKVQMPYGKGYLWMMCEHQDNNEMKAVGHVYKQGEKMFREGHNSSGYVCGNHIHLSCGFSKSAVPLNGTGWTRNSKGAWVLSIPHVTPIHIGEAFYSTTTKKNAAGTVPSKSPYKVGETYQLVHDLNVRIGAGTNKARIGVSKWTKDAKKYATSDGKLKKGTKVTCKDFEKKNGEWWLKSPTGWMQGIDSTGKVNIK